MPKVDSRYLDLLKVLSPSINRIRFRSWDILSCWDGELSDTKKTFMDERIVRLLDGLIACVRQIEKYEINKMYLLKDGIVMECIQPPFSSKGYYLELGFEMILAGNVGQVTAERITNRPEVHWKYGRAGKHTRRNHSTVLLVKNQDETERVLVTTNAEYAHKISLQTETATVQLLVEGKLEDQYQLSGNKNRSVGRRAFYLSPLMPQRLSRWLANAIEFQNEDRT